MANLGYIQVTRQCNQLCRFCSNPPSGLENTLETACGHVDDFVARGYHGVILTGGEPTMVPWLADLVRYARKRDLHVRVITNGQFLGEGTLLADLVAAGLRHVHVSLYSYRPELQDELARHPGSHANIVRTLERIAARDDVTADVNCVINHFNAGELDRNVRFVLERFPFVRHFVWNNLDPRMNRVAENPDTIPKLWELELSLYRAMRLVDESGRTFRVERVPLCYMVDYAHCSTETRKIVKEEERIVHFLDQKGFVRQASGGFVHGKTDACKLCTLDSICAGLDGLGEFFDGAELYPVFVDPLPIIKRVRKEEGAG
ncbi:MAG: radical SAM protein [Deltaproteobacteria bacterium]|nr:radical SAM protein [Deltaproteobacteria bacterium]